MRIALYGGFGEKGRTCIGVESAGYRLLLDAGIKTSARGKDDYYPAVDAATLRAIDGMLVTHAHEDHVGALGWCIAGGFRGPIYMTPETRAETVGCLADYAESADCALVHRAPIQALRVGDDALRLGPFRVTSGRSGHVAGGVWFRLDDGRTNIVYCGDVAPGSAVFAMDAPPACNALLLDASYGDDATGARERVLEIAAWIDAHPQGCILPTPLYGRSAELLAIASGPLAVAPGMRDALRTQLQSAEWLAHDAAPGLIARLARAEDWRPGDPLPRAALLCHDAMGIGGTSPDLLQRALHQSHPTLFTGHLPAGSPGERMVAEARAAWIRLPTHPTLPENAALVANCAPATVLGHSCDRPVLARLAQHLPRLRADLATGDSIDL